MAKIVIIGAGPTGLSAAYHLEKLGFTDYILFEKESTVGGLCRSVYQDGFTFDYTGHLLHVNDDYFRSFIANLVGLEHFNTITRQSFIYSHGVYTDYPFQINLFGLPQNVIVECIEGFLKRDTSRGKPHSFIQWVNKSFGKGFAKHFFMPYQKKIFAHDLSNISASWTGRFVPKTSLKQIINGALFKPENELTKSIGYNAQFLYPRRGGIQFWLEKIAEHIKQPIQLNSCVNKINLNNKTVELENGQTESFEYVINTMPLDTLLDHLKEKSSHRLKQATKQLKCNKVVNFNLGIKNKKLTGKHWVYYPEKQYPFYRIGFPHMLSEHMAPNDCSSLAGEFAHINKSQQWINTMLKRSIDYVKNLFDIEKNDIVTQKIMHIQHAYVIYDFWREKNLPKLLKKLEDESIYCAGRYAQWKYASMQEAILDGKQVVNKLLIKPAHKAKNTYTIQNTFVKKPLQKKIPKSIARLRWPEAITDKTKG